MCSDRGSNRLCGLRQKFSEPDLFHKNGRRIGNNKSSVSASGNAGHAVNSSFLANHTKAVIDTLTCAARTESLATCYMRPLNNVLPLRDGVLYVFHDFETTQNTRCSEAANVHVPNLLCVQ